MKSCFFRSDGTVTMFCTLIMMVLVLFFMVLIDFCRLFLFHRTTEAALKLSAQSVISAYDEQLYKEYGLFARGGTESEALFRGAMELNLMNSVSVFSLNQGHDFAATKIEELEVYATEFLGQHSVFEGQILEEMKYKAPIDFTLELVEQWLPMQEAVTKATALIAVINDLQALYEQREKLLEDALAQQKVLGDLLSASFKKAITTSADSTISRYHKY